LSQIAGIGATLAGTGLGQTLFGSPATGGKEATSGILGATAKDATNWMGNKFNSMFGSTELKTGEYPLADGGTMIVANDGSRKIITQGGDVQEFTKEGNPVGSGPTEKDLYGYDSPEQQAAREKQQEYDQQQLENYQNFYDYPPDQYSTGA
jgi:hypothetical protein